MTVQRSEMKAWAKEKMVGLENCIIPSFTPDLSELDEEGIRWDVQQSIKSGYLSTLCSAEVGLSFEEAKRFIEIVADEAKDKILVSTTLFNNSIEQNIELAKHAAKVGVHNGLLGYPPNYYPESEEQIFQDTKKITEASDLGIVLYATHKLNFERFHPSGFRPALLERLSDLDTVVACKIGSADWGFISEVFERCGEKILVNCPMISAAPAMIKAYKQQWCGAAVYEMFQSPEQPFVVDFYNLLLEGKDEEAMQIYWRIEPLLKMFEMHLMTIMLGTYNWGMLKYHQWCVGFNGGFPRMPVLKMYTHMMMATKMSYSMVGIIPREPDEEFWVGRSNYKKQ